MIAFALRADGWYLRQDIIWEKPNPMPESVTDRCTKSHEYIFLLSKSKVYYYDHEAIKEKAVCEKGGNYGKFGGNKYSSAEARVFLNGNKGIFSGNEYISDGTRNKRDVWTVSAKPISDAHFATYPPDLILPCILAGSREGGTVLDCFCGSGTTGIVALNRDRNFIGIELNPEYAELSKRRIENNVGYTIFDTLENL